MFSGGLCSRLLSLTLILIMIGQSVRVSVPRFIEAFAHLLLADARHSLISIARGTGVREKGERAFAYHAAGAGILAFFSMIIFRLASVLKSLCVVTEGRAEAGS